MSPLTLPQMLRRSADMLEQSNDGFVERID